jgi:hypothetical protein
MDIASLASTAIMAQKSMLVNNLQMAMLKSSIENQSATVLQLLEGSSQATSNPPNLGNLIDTTA